MARGGRLARRGRRPVTSEHGARGPGDRRATREGGHDGRRARRVLPMEAGELGACRARRSARCGARVDARQSHHPWLAAAAELLTAWPGATAGELCSACRPASSPPSCLMLCTCLAALLSPAPTGITGSPPRCECDGGLGWPARPPRSSALPVLAEAAPDPGAGSQGGPTQVDRLGRPTGVNEDIHWPERSVRLAPVACGSAGRATRRGR